MAGKCPYCGKNVLSLRINGVDASATMGTRWNALTYNCPSCQAVLGCQIDPIAIKTDILNEIKKLLGR